MDLSEKSLYVVTEYESDGTKKPLGIFDGNIVDIAFTVSKGNPLEFTKLTVAKIESVETPSRLDSVIRVTNMEEFSETHLFTKINESEGVNIQEDVINKFSPGPLEYATINSLTDEIKNVIRGSSMSNYITRGKSINLVNEESLQDGEIHLRKIPFVQLIVDEEMPAVKKALYHIKDCTEDELKLIKSLD